VLVRLVAWVVVVALAACTDGDAGPDADLSCTDCGCSTCNPIGQLGCGMGERCTYFHDGAGGAFDIDENCDSDTACVPEGTIPMGGACEITPEEPDGCVGALLCSQGACRELCGPPEPTCTSGLCPLAHPFAPGMLLAACAEACDPLAPTCGAGESCYLPTRTGEATGCVTAGVLLEGEACRYAEDCVAGATCVTRVCRRICDPTAPDCTSPLACEPYAAGAGVCR